MGVLDNSTIEAMAGLEARVRRRPRVPAVDILRGLAVVAMAVYHTAWDLSALAIADLEVTGSPGWNAFARIIASSFLVLAGIGLVLAHGEGIRWGRYWRRIGVILVAALVVTGATALAFPHAYIFFGILHNMAVSSIVAIPFVAAPPILAAGAAAIAWTLPLLVSGGVFDLPALAFLGLGRVPPLTYDWVPVLPWTGFVLAGIALARPTLRALPAGQGGRLGFLLATLGRYSLVIYLVHQPVIFGALATYQRIAGPNPQVEAAPFLREFVRSCRATGRSEDPCRKAGDCTVDALRRDGIWGAIRRGDASAEFMQRAGNRAAECMKRSSGS